MNIPKYAAVTEVSVTIPRAKYLEFDQVKIRDLLIALSSSIVDDFFYLTPGIHSTNVPTAVFVSEQSINGEVIVVDIKSHIMMDGPEEMVSAKMQMLFSDIHFSKVFVGKGIQKVRIGLSMPMRPYKQLIGEFDPADTENKDNFKIWSAR